LFAYEWLLFSTLENHKHVWIKKATGKGITGVHVVLYRMAVPDIEAAIEGGRKIAEISTGNSSNSAAASYSQKSVGLDPGFGSSNFGVCITELVDGVVNVVHA
jgi:hypothetical protein